MVPTWTYGNWSDCSVTCGTGTQTRTHQCVYTDGTSVTGQCSGDPLVEQNCIQQECPTWTYGNWSDCSVTCGTGTQTRTRQCVNTDGTEANGLCSGDPSVEQNCIQQECPTWTYGNWSDCSVTCGTGTQSRTHQCAYTVGTFADGLCSGDPLVEQNCIQQECPTWTYGNWSGCSVTCGTGTQTRTYQCVHTDGTDPVGQCSGDPLVEQNCIQQECPTWTYGNWSDCSVTCGTGRQSRTHQCVHTDGTFANGLCSGDPLVEQICTQQECTNYSSVV
ncbi:A disintegrin and metalloproteinase with thrombospondin motifs gon-1-like [Amphiura filiformis]|uniref:A disintegrin and metalloproteinase with thrombospondin motifs gon-1-like n=1 Tax=Amphiura filiformis TaxID=82378 RepID=UPI003B20D6F0